MLSLLLNSKFGQVPSWATAKINSVGVDSIEEWAEKFLCADTLENVFSENNELSNRLTRPCIVDIQLTKEIIEFEDNICKPYLSNLVWNSMQKHSSKMFIMLLNSKFGQTPDWAAVKIREASVESIERWTERILHMNKLDDFYKDINESKHHGECVTMPVQLLTFCGMRVIGTHQQTVK